MRGVAETAVTNKLLIGGGGRLVSLAKPAGPPYDIVLFEPPRARPKSSHRLFSFNPRLVAILYPDR